MLALRLTQTSLAERMTEQGFPISQPLVSRAIHGAPLEDAELIAFARALTVSITWLLGLTETTGKWKPDYPLDQLPDTPSKRTGQRDHLSSVHPTGDDLLSAMRPIPSRL